MVWESPLLTLALAIVVRAAGLLFVSFAYHDA